LGILKEYKNENESVSPWHSSLIKLRKKRDGRTVYCAQIRIKRKGKAIYSESRTFERRSHAQDWGTRRKLELDQHGALNHIKHRAITIGDLIDKYVYEYGELARFGRTKRAHLQYLRRTDLANWPALTITAIELVEHVRQRRLVGAGPATAANDLIWLRVIYKTARAAWGVPLDIPAIEDAMQYLRSQGLIARAKHRERRPTSRELQVLSEYFGRRDKRATLPMHDIMWFAVHSARREGEITRLLWENNEERELMGLVRDHKHPRAKKGNHRRFKYTREAWKIVQRQPRTNARVFPYNEKSIGSAFTQHWFRLIPNARDREDFCQG
jgi:hypothetical protein